MQWETSNIIFRVTTSAASAGESEIVIKQRRQRPVAPHLSIYKPQLTWYPSMFNRLTGIVLSGGLYIYAIGYLFAPTLGWHWESASLAAGFAAWGVAAKVAAKTFLAAPFAFHSLNGLRHLAWDVGVGMGKQQVTRSAQAAIVATAVSTLYLVFAY